MKNTFVRLTFLGFLSIILFNACVNLEKDELFVILVNNASYQCENNDRVDVKYYSISDKSLNFIKIILPDGKEHTLAQSVSASGARYTDERDLVWWVKGSAAKMDIRDENGDWKIKYSRCIVFTE